MDQDAAGAGARDGAAGPVRTAVEGAGHLVEDVVPALVRRRADPGIAGTVPVRLLAAAGAAAVTGVVTAAVLRRRAARR
ncbi:hypothetical protein [Streptomyces sp. G-G2]|uniref:hypothetical protein n=1 Tax=Streptomyces sp. G-G2 TaxID=3046201 RepID=UPI0024BA738A|nr:hypothetical protein [Streptomyces sp. G-G2]MDJ0386212.1 hypothetical protein [Streptomyces sp. G-G2]